MARLDEWSEEVQPSHLHEYQLDDYMNNLVSKSNKSPVEEQQKTEQLWQGSIGLEKFMSTLKHFRRHKHKYSLTSPPEELQLGHRQALSPLEKQPIVKKQARRTIRQKTELQVIRPIHNRKISHVQLSFPEERRNQSNNARSRIEEPIMQTLSTSTRSEMRSLFQRMPSHLIKNIYHISSQLQSYDEKYKQARIRANMYKITRSRNETMLEDNSKKVLTEISQSPSGNKTFVDLKCSLTPNEMTAQRGFLPTKARLIKTSTSGRVAKPPPKLSLN